MSRRSLATVVVFVLLVGLAMLAVFVPVPYVVMGPGPTVNVLGETKDRPIVEVSGHKTYPTKGQLRLSTVSVTNPSAKVGLPQAIGAWFDGSRAVYPRAVIYPPDQSADEVEQQSAVEMVGSQDTAVAAALTELGYRLPVQVEVLAVTKGSPADGTLKVRDRVLEVDGTKITKASQVGTLVQRKKVGQKITVVVQRGSTRRTETLTTVASPDDPSKPVVGIQIGVGYDFPFN